jgi:protein transport protein SEC23
MSYYGAAGAGFGAPVQQPDTGAQAQGAASTGYSQGYPIQQPAQYQQGSGPYAPGQPQSAAPGPNYPGQQQFPSGPYNPAQGQTPSGTYPGQTGQPPLGSGSFQPGQSAAFASSGSPASPQAIDLAAPVPGVRWTFNAYPNTGKPKKAEASSWGPPTPEMILPLAVMYTPLFDPAQVAPADGPPPAAIPVIPVQTTADLPVCRNCRTHWNSHCRSDFQGGYWMCPACLNRNPLPQGASPNHPAVTNATVEYTIKNEPGYERQAPLFIYVVDVCLPEEELEALKESLLRSLEWLPEDALVGIITFGHGITLWEPGFGDLNKCYAFRGNRSYSKAELVAALGVPSANAAASPSAPANPGMPPLQTSEIGVNTGPVSGRFLVTLSEAEFTLTSMFEELQVDPFPPKPKERALRATGAALELAVSLVELVGGPARGGKVMLFTGGPCTRGPGAIVSVDKADMIRSTRDLLDGNAPFFEKAVEFYKGLEARLSDAHVAMDAVTMSLDQVGLLELRTCVDSTGGTMICGDSFTTAMFTESFKRAFQRAKLRADPCSPTAETEDATPAGCGFGALVVIHSSPDTKICGAIGPCRGRFGSNAAATSAAQGEARFISPIKIGVSDTTQWVMSHLDSTTTLSVVFDTEQDGAAPGAVVEPSIGQRRFVQFAVSYTLPNGSKRVRITSCSMPIARTTDATMYSQPNVFDQACAAAVTSRLAMDVMERHDNRPLDLTRRWIDRLLVRYVKKYGSYRVGDATSLRLQSVFSLFPVFLFNLRRSEYFMLLNISPDETTFKRHYLRREPCDHCLLMIQPAVDSYDMQSEQPTPVPLDSESIKRENVLLMDAFFNVAVLRGSTVEEWRKAGYQAQPEYAAFKSLLERPERDAEAILSTRLPYPRYTNCDQHGSQARHVLTRLNPSVSHNSGVADSRSFAPGHQGQIKEVIYTDDASIARFMQTLKAAAVAPDN